MFKKTIFLLILFTLLLSACSPAAASPSYATMEEPAAAPAEYYRADGGGAQGYAPAYDDVYMDYEEQSGANTVSGETAPAQTGERIVIKNASLSIAVQNPVENLDAIAKLADEFGGFVVSSNLYNTTLSNGAEVPQGNITIRVPAERLNEALELIKSGAGRILSENVSGQEDRKSVV